MISAISDYSSPYQTPDVPELCALPTTLVLVNKVNNIESCTAWNPKTESCVIPTAHKN